MDWEEEDGESWVMINLTALIAFVLIIVLYVIIIRMSLIFDDIIEGKDIEEVVEKIKELIKKHK